MVVTPMHCAPEAVKAVAVIKPKITVPMHAWDANLQEFARIIPRAKVEILQEKDLEL